MTAKNVPWRQLKPLEQHIEQLRFPSVVIRGHEAIASYMGCSRPTLSRWVKQLGFPVFKEGDKASYTSTHAITMWILAISRGPREYPSGGGIRRNYGTSYPRD